MRVSGSARACSCTEIMSMKIGEGDRKSSPCLWLIRASTEAICARNSGKEATICYFRDCRRCQVTGSYGGREEQPCEHARDWIKCWSSLRERWEKRKRSNFYNILYLGKKAFYFLFDDFIKLSSYSVFRLSEVPVVFYSNYILDL